MSTERETARQLFAEFVGEAGQDPDIEELCRRHPEHAETLRELHVDYRDGLRLLGKAGASGGGGGDAMVLEDALSALAAPRDAGSYRRLGALARGGMSEVEHVWDEQLQRPLVRKVLPIDSRKAKLTTIERRRLGRFLDEARIAAQLQHPAILTVLDAGVDRQGRPYFVMPVVRGQHFGEIVRRVRDPRDEEWTLTRALGVLERVCGAMAYAHDRGVIHRDLKPSNVMVGRFGEAYVMDWGLAKIVGRAEDPGVAELSVELESLRDKVAAEEGSSSYLTMDGDIVGTPAYMAPEQAAGQVESVGKLSDVYAVGAMLYELLTGRQPYTDPGLSSTPEALLESVRREAPRGVHEVEPDVPAELAAICEKAMARDPDARYPDMLALAAELRAFLERRVVKAYQTGAIAELRMWVTRNRGQAIALAVALLAVVVGLLAGIGLQAEQRQALVQSNQELEQTRRELTDRVELLRRSKYLNDLTEVQRILAAGNDVGQVRALLENTDEDLRAWEWRYLDRISDQSVRTFRGHEDAIVSLAVSPDDKLLATASRDPRLVLWDVATGKRLWSVEDGIDSLAFSPDGKHLATASGSPYVHIWDVTTGALRCELEGQHRADLCVCLDGARVASAGDHDAAVHVWDWQQGREVGQLPMTGVCRHLAYSHQRGLLAAAGGSGPVRLWHGQTLEPVGEIGDRKGTICLVQFDSDGRKLLVGRTTGALETWAVETARLDAEEDHGECDSMELSADERWLVTTKKKQIRVQDRGTSRPITTLHTCSSSRVLTAGCRVFAGGGTGTVKMFELAALPPHRLYRSPATKAGIHGVAITKDGTRIACCRYDGRIDVWRTDNPDNPLQINTGNRPLHAIAFAPDGEGIAAVGQLNRITIWDAETGQVHSRRDGLTVLNPFRVAFSPAGNQLVMGTDDNRILYALDLPLSTGRRWSYTSTKVWGIAFLPGGESFATADEGGLVRIWDAKRFELLRSWTASRKKGIYDIAVSSDGKRIATTGTDQLAPQLWTAEGELLHELPGHTSLLLAVAFSPDSRRLFSTGWDGTIRIWDVATGRPMLVLDAADSVLRDVAISDDGRVLVAGGHSGVVHAWVIDEP